jgi:hypothetical protein
VSVQATGSVVQLDVIDGGSGAHVIRRAPHLVIVPRVLGRILLRVAPTDAQVFPAGSFVALTLGVDRPGDPDPERVQLPATDVSGLPYRDLVVVVPRDGFLAVAATAATDDHVLPELVSRARAATREVLAIDRVPDEHAVHVVVALDASASTRRLADSGALVAVLEVLLGISRVIGTSGDVPRVALVAAGTEWVHAADIGELSGATTSALTALPARIGFRSAQPALRGLLPDENVVTYVVTDGIPADVDALEADDAIEGEARHLVTLGPSGAGTFPPASSPLRTHVDAVVGQDLRAELLARPARLLGLVRELLIGCFAPGTDLARRSAP